MALQWAAPPENAVKGGEKHTKWGEVAGMLRTNPGEWAKVAMKPTRTSAVSLTNGISAGKRPEFEPAGAYGSAYAPNPEDVERFDVFARYIGASVNGLAEAAVAPADSDDDDAWDDSPEP